MANQPKRVAILGFDCAEPHLFQQHIAEGHLPNFKKVFGQGVLAENCLSPFPTITPPNWASIATGAWPGTHNVTDFHLHKEGTSQVNANIFQGFSSENCKAEFIWDRLDAAGKKCIVCNYPGSWPSKMKNGIMVQGSGLSIGEMRNGHPGLESLLMLGNDEVITTGYYPNSTRVEFKDAEGWKNLPAGTEDPLAAKFNLAFRTASEQMAPVTWYALATQSSGNGYDRITVSPTQDVKDALFTLSRGDWSKKTFVKFKTQDGRVIEAFFMAKLVQLSDDAEDFLLFIPAFCPTEGWINPPELAKELMDGEGLFTFAGGLVGYTMGLYDMDTWAEVTELHDKWLGDMFTRLLTKHPWDLFAMHSHPMDWTYHGIMTEMDDNTCSSKELQKKAWAMHLRVAQSQDKLLGRIMEAAGEDTLFVLVSDHGAAADGTPFNPYIPLIKAGLCIMEGQEVEGDTKALEEAEKTFHQLAREQAGDKMCSEVIDMATLNMYSPNITRSKAFPQRTIYIYINLKGRDPGGIVEPADYEKVQQQIIDALYAYVDATTGKRPVALALSRKDARILGLYGEHVGDVVYAIYPEYGGQHGPHLPTTEWGIGKLKALEAYYGPGIKKGFKLERTCGLTDVVPTVCYMMDWPVPAETEGCVLYQVFDDPNFKEKQVAQLKDRLAKMETELQKGSH